ncbi:MAG: glycoside hydrolase family 3 N-terminal domain-containing protein [Jatrophihabitantaceae bacterium]
MGRGVWRAIGAVVLITSACSPSPPARDTRTPSGPGPTRHSSPPSTISSRQSNSAPTTRTPSAPPPAGGLARRVLAGMSEAERVGQLLMVDCPSTQVADATITAIATYHVGSVILDGTSELGAAQTLRVVTVLKGQSSAPAGLFIATDQEGGQVQRLQGPGFSAIPSALEQGALAPYTLRADAGQWATELQAAGVNVDLGPVLDTVPRNFGSNPPIGDLDREFGHDPLTVSSHGTAVVHGLQAAGVSATAKHFPGLGRVRGNPDLSAGVRDSATTRDDAYLAPFAAAIRDGVAFVMMSTAIYTRIDPRAPAAFSPVIVTGMLRGDLHFRGVIISDDVGAAKQASGLSAGARAVAFIAAGGSMVLTVDATQAPEMTAALLARAKHDPAFRAQIDAAALVVLQAKQVRGLLS